MNKLQKKIGDITHDQKERALEEKAKDMGFGYVNFAITKIQIEALRIIPEEVSVELGIICFFAIHKKIRVAVVNEKDVNIKNYLSKLKGDGYSININLCSEESMQIGLKSYGKHRKSTVQKKITTNEDVSESTDLTESQEGESESYKGHNYLNKVYKNAITEGISDVHIEPKDNDCLIRFRIDGLLQDYDSIDHGLYNEILRIIKHSCAMTSNISDIAQDGQYYFEIDNRKVDLRASVLPTGYGESIVLRVLDSKKGQISIDQLNLFPIQKEILDRNLLITDGMILVSGPTGSGKTTTLYSIINQLNTPEKKIITLEDPVEYHLSGITQSQISDKYSFADGLKASLRHDPDIIMLGEIREKQAARTAMQASITGHKVISTVHTNSAIESIVRLKDLQIEEYLITSSLTLVIGQRLIRKNCSNCVEKKEINKQTLDLIKSKNLHLGIKPGELKYEYESRGCEQCNDSGYKGREVVCEFLEIDDTIKNMISTGVTTSDLKHYLNKIGFISMEASAIVKAIKGITSFKEAFKVII